MATVQDATARREEAFKITIVHLQEASAAHMADPAWPNPHDLDRYMQVMCELKLEGIIDGIAKRTEAAGWKNMPRLVDIGNETLALLLRAAMRKACIVVPLYKATFFSEPIVYPANKRFKLFIASMFGVEICYYVGELVRARVSDKACIGPLPSYETILASYLTDIKTAWHKKQLEAFRLR